MFSPPPPLSLFLPPPRFHNKGVYLQLGLQKMVSKGEVSKLHQHIRVFVDDRVIDLPECEGIVFLNIQSWGAGADPWGSASDSVRSMSMNMHKSQILVSYCCSSLVPLHACSV